ncbi:MAG: SDR family NAD(P)-dependent oxidoreductase [Verrucomicrobiota bacterium]
MIKKALLTGTTGGLGTEIAKILAQDGWNLVLLNRNSEQSKQQIASLNSEFASQTFDSFQVNLMDLHDIRQVSQEIADAHPQIAAIYNVAGLLTDKRIMSAQEIESHFALNTLAPYMILQAFKPQLKASASQENPAFIANFSSSAIDSVKTLNVDQLVNPEKIGGLLDAYAKTKAALNVMACFLKEELSADHIYIYAVDPGPTKTKMTSNNQGMPWFLKPLVPFLFKDPQTQAKTLLEGIQAAIQKHETGVFISNGKVKNHPAFAHDPETQNELRQLMDQLIA